MNERLQKILSQWGIASRREAEQLILDGRVRLNGAIAQVGQRANPECDRIEVDGNLIQSGQRPQSLYLLLHKPLDVVSTCDDPWGRKTVLDLLPPHLNTGLGLHPVGRLDANSTGALLLTNDGAVTFSLTHPSHAIPKTYEVLVTGQPSELTLQQWRDGILLNEQKTLPAEVKVLKSLANETLLQVKLYEGRNRQIRRVAKQLGHPVVRLHRTTIGSIQLGNLPPAAYRPLSNEEISYLQEQSRSLSQISSN